MDVLSFLPSSQHESVFKRERQQNADRGPELAATAKGTPVGCFKGGLQVLWQLGIKNSEPGFKSRKGKGETRARRIQEEPRLSFSPPSLRATFLYELTGV